MVCPLCGNELKKYFINLTYTVTMCPHSECSYPFLAGHPDLEFSVDENFFAQGNHNLKKPAKSNQVNEVNNLRNDIEFDQAIDFDIQVFLEQYNLDYSDSEVSASYSEVLDDLLAATDSCNGTYNNGQASSLQLQKHNKKPTQS